MATKQPPSKKPGKPTEQTGDSAGKPTVGPETREDNVGQREESSSKPEGQKPPVGPEKHDNVGQRGVTTADDNDVE